MNFINEHTWLGYAGHLLVIIAFVSALASAFSYFVDSKQQDEITESRKLFSRMLHFVHSLAVALVILLLFYAIRSHYFEYHYVWKYSNLAMEAKYIFSCFWSGQEGSLLLWSFWIMVLSWLVHKAGWVWETRVLPVVLLSQAFIFSMLLGVYFGSVKVGSDPFILIRELPENASMPWARMDDYLLRITSFQDGVGLNPLLQNYWMTIHPPVLFLGFAATLFPFAFAVAGAFDRNKTGWTKSALPWSVFALAVLGCGILLGGAWAYESLSFGGFWAWDPVENASLVPWLVLAGGVHCLQVTLKIQRGAYPSMLFSVAPFLLVLYSSYLTRSGVLGESSVHSFTENGLSLHLLLFLSSMTCLGVLAILQTLRLRIVFVALMAVIWLAFMVTGNLVYTLTAAILAAAVLLLLNYEKNFNKPSAQISYSAREFWIFAGVMLLLVSGFQIMISTSIPVLNRIFGTQLDAFTDLSSRNAFYHTWQIPLAILVAALIGLTKMLSYRRTHGDAFLKNIARPMILAIAITALMALLLKIHPFADPLIFLLMLSCSIAVTLNADTIRNAFRKGGTNTGSSIAHIGFALLLLGALISGARRTVISKNLASFSLEELNKEFRNDENVLLKQGKPVLMRDYFVSYSGKQRKGPNLIFTVDYFRPVLDENSGALTVGEHLFSLQPIVQMNEQFGNVSEPGTRHFLTHDVFTHVKYADMDVAGVSEEELNDGFMKETALEVASGKSVRLENYEFTLKDIYLLDDPLQKERAGFEKADIVVKALLSVRNTDFDTARHFEVAPLFAVRDSVHIVTPSVYSKDLDANLRITALGREPNTLMLGLSQREFIVMQASVFPGMNILWTGCALLVVGCLISLLAHVRKPKQKKSVPAERNRIETTEGVSVKL